MGEVSGGGNFAEGQAPHVTGTCSWICRPGWRDTQRDWGRLTWETASTV